KDANFAHASVIPSAPAPQFGVPTSSIKPNQSIRRYKNYGFSRAGREAPRRTNARLGQKICPQLFALVLRRHCPALHTWINPRFAPLDPTADSTLPARTLRGYLMVVGVMIDDRGPFDFLVDTGTNTTLLDPRLARELGLQARDTLRLDSLSSSAGVPRYFLQK